ncbi:hypothetical protein DS745_19110 [Anaerobacillus alkaliphilus]|uniref:Uncharacterized protein n=1 Tax=Anaerobacillus alkaliphilus TaxID=1548597 RepID=A0A4Q0VPN0_9BACI|nr:hypothetical protein [Anaerobacillus alkaliphilus]RXI98436.1 hypothetical protein DS745_19110 [Anaerobacillus alkaliphilus]
MDMLRRVKIEYGLSDLQWVKTDEIFQSESGKKRIRFWKDKQLLQWHVKWRDEISKQSGILLDRMIRTKDGEPFFICDKGWATIHDEIDGEYPTLGKEKDWGRLIGHSLAYGLHQSDECQRFRKRQEPSLKSVKQMIDQLDDIDPMVKLVLERSYFEANNRSRKAQQLKKRIQQNKLPILTPFSNLENAREVFFHLFWVCGADQPVQGYEPVRKFLEDWFSNNGEDSTIALLDNIDHYFSLKEEQGLLLITELLTPYELDQTVIRLSEKNSETAKIMDDYFKDWETTRKLVILLSGWIEKEREKAVAK